MYLLSAATIAVVVLLLALGTGGSAMTDGPPCGRATDAVVRSTTLAVARRLRDEERAGATVTRARRSIEADRVLADAVARGDAAAARSEALVLLFNHEHIVRLRVLRAGAPIADVGGRFVLTPVFATLRAGGRVVGSVEYSVQDDMGYRLLAKRLVGVDTVMRHGGRTVMADVNAGSRSLPDSGTVEIGGARYLVATIVTRDFPNGRLRITLLIPRPTASLALESCPQVRTDVLRDIAQRVYEEALRGPVAVIARAIVRSSLVLPAAVAAGRDATARRSARRLLRAGHLVRLAAVTSGGRVVADVGVSEPALGPVVTLRRHGAAVGSALLAIQSANGFVGVSSYLTGADVLVRDGAQQLAGRVTGPASLPPSGPATWNGRGYHVASFDATIYPAGRVTVYSLVRG
jgi:hypothetical protein